MDIRNPGLESWQAIAITVGLFAAIVGGSFALAGIDLVWQRRQDHYYRHPNRRRLTERTGRRLGVLWHAALDGTHRTVRTRPPVMPELGWTTEADVIDVDPAEITKRDDRG